MKHFWKIIIAIVFILVLFLNWHFEFFAINFNKYCQDYRFKVFCFNVHSSDPDFSDNCTKILDIINSQKTEFIYLTEYGTDSDNQLHDSLAIYYQHNLKLYDEFMDGERIYSKWKIDTIARIRIDTTTIKYKEYAKQNDRLECQSHFSHILRTEISDNGDTIILYTCHLASQFYDAKSKGVDTLSIFSMSKWKLICDCIDKGNKLRELEVDAIITRLKAESHPVIILGDMNAISGTSTISSIEECGFDNAWWKGGCGYGGTFCNNWSSLRIDHILYDKHLVLKGVKVISSEGKSDHNALVAIFNIK